MSKKTKSKLIRMSTEDLLLISEAAAISRESLSAFMVNSAIVRAKDIVLNSIDEKKESIEEERELSTEERLALIKQSREKYGLEYKQEKTQKPLNMKKFMKSFDDWAYGLGKYCEKTFGPIPDENDPKFTDYLEMVKNELRKR